MIKRELAAIEDQEALEAEAGAKPGEGPSEPTAQPSMNKMLALSPSVWASLGAFDEIPQSSQPSQG